MCELLIGFIEPYTPSRHVMQMYCQSNIIASYSTSDFKKSLVSKKEESFICVRVG